MQTKNKALLLAFTLAVFILSIVSANDLVVYQKNSDGTHTVTWLDNSATYSAGYSKEQVLQAYRGNIIIENDPESSLPAWAKPPYKKKQQIILAKSQKKNLRKYALSSRSMQKFKEIQKLCRDAEERKRLSNDMIKYASGGGNPIISAKNSLSRSDIDGRVAGTDRFSEVFTFSGVIGLL